MEYASLQFLFLLFLLSLWLYLYLLLSSKKKPTNYGFKIYPVVGALPDLLRNRHKYLDWLTEILRECPANTSSFCWPGNVQSIFTANPTVVEHILKTNFENYPKGDQVTSLLEDFLGRGIFNVDGELWKIQRKTASYEFSTKSLRNFVMDNVQGELSKRLVPIFSNAAKTNKTLDLQDLLERFAFDNICKLAFNVDPGCLGEEGTTGGEFMCAFQDVTTRLNGRLLSLFPKIDKILKFLNIGSERKLKTSIRIAHQFADEIIRSRMEQKSSINQNEKQDLLSRFLGNEENSLEFLRDIVISFILAGRDTTSSALSWFFWLLSLHPDVESKILKELKAIRSRTNCEFEKKYVYGFEDLRDMHYLHAAISESMRLYPPVPVDSKVCKSNDVLPDGTIVRKNWCVTYHTYAMGRMKGIWGEDCHEFKPERWLENGVCKHESAFKYPVFHAGPRLCLGKDMAFIQMKAIVATVLEMFEIVVINNEKIPGHLLSLTLRMKGGLPVKVKSRVVRSEPCDQEH